MKRLFNSLLVLLLLNVPGFAAERPVRIIAMADKDVLNPVLNPNETAVIYAKAITSSGKTFDLDPAGLVFAVKNKLASGPDPILELKANRAYPKEGGLATVSVIATINGQTFYAETDILVRPFYREYHQTLVLKLFMGMEGEPVDRLADQPLFQKPHDVLCSFADAIELIRKVDHITSGIPKIIYLVGWQEGGHDHQFPSWEKVNPKLKRKEDATALESLRWLIREARQYHTTVSLHINMADAYKSSPLWDEYVKKDIIARDLQGNLLSSGIQIKGDSMYNVSYTREWAEGLAQRRIDRLVEMIPELLEGHTIHVDVFVAKTEHQPTLSPWHAKKENGGIDIYKEVETQRKIFKYWRQKGFDVTGEGLFWAHPPGEGFYGLQPMAWWYPADHSFQLQVPEKLSARGRTDRQGDGDFRFGSSMHGEEIFIENVKTLPGFLQQFHRTTLIWHYLSRLDRIALINDTLFYSNGVKAFKSGSDKLITQGRVTLRKNNDLFVPAGWLNKTIIAYSEAGYKGASWQLPADWFDVKKVDLFEIGPAGRRLVGREEVKKGGVLTLSLSPEQAVAIIPSSDR